MTFFIQTHQVPPSPPFCWGLCKACGVHIHTATDMHIARQTLCWSTGPWFQLPDLQITLYILITHHAYLYIFATDQATKLIVPKCSNGHLQKQVWDDAFRNLCPVSGSRVCIIDEECSVLFSLTLRGNVSAPGARTARAGRAPGIFFDPCPTGGLLPLICWATLYGFAPWPPGHQQIWDGYGPSRTRGDFFDFKVGGHDGAYKGRIHVIVPLIGRKNGTLTARQQCYNDVPGWYRAHIEQLFARLWHAR